MSYLAAEPRFGQLWWFLTPARTNSLGWRGSSRSPSRAASTAMSSPTGFRGARSHVSAEMQQGRRGGGRDRLHI